jgi:hypothetical protein
MGETINESRRSKSSDRRSRGDQARRDHGRGQAAIPAASNMASVMTLDSIEELGLKKGDRVRVVVKAVNVLLIKD